MNKKISFTLKIIVMIFLLLQLINTNWSNIFICLITLLLFYIPNFLKRKSNIIISETLEIIVYLFIFCSEILGEILNFFNIYSYWDSILHGINGFICAAIGFSLIDILNNNVVFHKSIKTIFSIVVAISFSMMIGILWEFIEFSVDYYFSKDMQKDQIIRNISSQKLNLNKKSLQINNINKTIIYSNNSKNKLVIDGGYLDIGLIDTMKDLFVNLLGAIVFSILSYFNMNDENRISFIKQFILINNKN